MLVLFELLENVYCFLQYIVSMPLMKFLIINFIIYIIWSLRAILSSRTLIVNENSTMSKLLDKMPSIHSGYKPTLWCVPSGVNTLVHHLIQKNIKIDYKREVIFKFETFNCRQKLINNLIIVSF
jgi:hypothetical protein